VTDHELGPDWVAPTAGALHSLGFTLLNSDRPAAPEGSQLLVALRDRPTLRHFDPELIRCWVAMADRGRPIEIDRHSATGDRPVLWGHVHVVDRLGVENRFLTFGGRVRVADVSPELRVVRHVSPGPVVRWGGHSQGWDPLAGEIGAFFGRLIVPVDFAPGGEARITTEPPEHLYAAFLRDAAARRRATRPRSSRTDSWRGDPLQPWIDTEVARIRSRHAPWWTAAGALLDDIDLGPEGQATERAAADRADR
jgi:hypothetical protein